MAVNVFSSGERSMDLKKRNTGVSLHLVLSITLLLFISALMGFTIHLVRTKLLQNTQQLGMALVKSYALEEESQINSFRSALEMGALYVDVLQSTNSSPETIQQWLMKYFDKVTDTFGPGSVDSYAVIDGKIIAANPWEWDGNFNFSQRAWYTDALASAGEVVFSDVYTDSITGEPVITVSKALQKAGDVFAMDVYLDNPALHISTSSLPESYSCYLFDSQGTLVYAITHWDVDRQTLQQFGDQLMEGMQSGRLVAYDASFQDPEGVSRGAYAYEMSNGWSIIVTIPMEQILYGERNIAYILLICLGGLLLLALTYMLLRDLHNHKRLQKADNTIQILSDSYYAIYRINFHSERYESIKSSPDVACRISTSGDYETLLQVIQEFVEENTFEAFEQSFSLESIRKRVAENIHDYGGDFRRSFDGVYQWVNIRTLYDAERAPEEVIWCFRNVDAEKRQQLQHTLLLQQALDTAKQSTRAKSVFFSSMSHDMRTPLNAILGYADLAQKTSDCSPKVMGYLDKISFAGQQLLSLINDILEFSRLEAGKSELNTHAFDLRSFVEKTADLFRAQADKEHKTYTVSIQFQDETVIGDEFKIGQLLNNILSNAFKYSNPGASISLEAKQFEFQKHSKFQFIITDTGIGMSAEFLEHLFDPYSRETHFSSKGTIGTGLGMYIVKSLVQQMSGEISVESKLGQGSRFIITLPLETVVSGHSSTQESSSEALTDLTGYRILLAEDNALNREIATEMLTMNGAEVIPAENGQEAVVLFQQAAPFSIHAILMDMQMPVMDGCAAAEAIRALDKPDAASVPIIAVTANAFAEDIDRTTKAGMNGHIAKPIDFALLTQTLHRLCTAGTKA